MTDRPRPVGVLLTGLALLAGHRVPWCATTEPDWTGYRDPGAVTGVTLPLSEDDLPFAVQARDREGHLSPATVPVPAQ